MPLTRSVPATDRSRPALPLWRLGEGAPPAGAFVALVPGDDAPLIALTLPAALAGAARLEVARRQVHDRLGAGLEMRPWPVGGHPFSRVAVAERARVLRWRQALGPAQARCRGLLPDYLALPSAPGVWVIEVAQGRVRARLGSADGFTAAVPLAVAMLAQALRQPGEAPKGLLRLGAPEATLDALLADLPAAPAVEVFARGETGVDFGLDTPNAADRVGARLRGALVPGLLLALGALGWAGSVAVAARQDRARADAIEAQVLAAAQRDLLGAEPVIDLRRQVTRAIEARQVPVVASRVAPPLQVLRRAAPVLAQAGSVQAVILARDTVEIEITLADFAALDALSVDLVAQGLGVQVLRSASGGDSGVSATLRLEGTP